MKRVARRVALNLSEAKRFSVINDDVFGSSATATNLRWRYKNIFAQLPTNTGTFAGSSVGVEGNEIVDLMVKMKAECRIPFANMLGNSNRTAGFGSVWFHVYLVAVNDYAGSGSQASTPPPYNLSWTTYPDLFTSADPGWFITNNPIKPTLNGNNVKVIRRWTKKYTPQPQQNFRSTADTIVDPVGQISLNLQCKHKFRGKKTFEDNVFGDTDGNFTTRSGALRGWNYYWLCGWGTIGSYSLAEQPSMNMDQFLYFKDP